MPMRLPPASCRDCALVSLPAFSVSKKEAVARGEDVRTGTRQFRGGDYIFHAGDPVREAYTLFDGYAVVYHPVDSGDWQVIRFLLPGDLLYQLPDGDQGWRNSAMVVDYATACVLSVNALNQLFARDIWFARDMARIIDHEERLLEEHITAMGQRPALERVVRLLLELFQRQRMPRNTDGPRCYLPFTQEQIGDAVGLTSVYVSRLLGHLHTMKILSLRNRWLEVPDFDATARQFEYEPTHLEPKPMI